MFLQIKKNVFILFKLTVFSIISVNCSAAAPVILMKDPSSNLKNESTAVTKIQATYSKDSSFKSIALSLNGLDCEFGKWSVNWNSKLDFDIPYPVRVDGSVSDVVSSIYKSILESNGHVRTMQVLGFNEKKLKLNIIEGINNLKIIYSNCRMDIVDNN